MTSVPANPVSTVVAPPGGIHNFTATATNLYVDTGSQLITYTLGGALVSSFTLPAHFAGATDQVYQPVIDPSGNIYLSSYYGKMVDKFSPSGTLMWSVDPQGGNPTSVFSVGTGSNFKVIVSLVQNTSSSVVLDPNTGAVTGTFPLVVGFASYVSHGANGNLLYSNNGHVETVSPTGQVLASFGSSHINGNGVHAGSGTQFYYPAQAAQGPDGTIYTADPLHTVEATSPAGLFDSSTTLGDNLNFGGWDFALVGSTFYFESGAPFTSNQVIGSFTLATLQAYLNAVQAPTDSLGWGAGLSTPAAGNYFAAGTTPSATASFDPWWASVAPKLTLSYSIENTASLNAGTMPPPQTVPLPSGAAGLASIPLVIPPEDKAPGPYEVRAVLLDNRTSPPTTLGTTCMPYAVGAAGNNLNFATLPAGAGTGGPADSRGVALNAQLGLSGLRGLTNIDWNSVLPACDASAPTATTCGPSAMNLGAVSQDPYKAAFLANKDHVAYWIQVSGGDAVSKALVAGGWWQGDVTAIVAHYATVPSGCVNCAPVTKWEPWNEANNTGWGNAASYVSSVLTPFYTAVKSVLPGAASTVIGGATLEPSIGWWQQLIAAGGLSYMDVASIHPYTGSNESYEEEGMQTQIRQLQTVLGTKPLWFTEAGWWSDGDFNFLSQADNVARSLIWQKVLGIPVNNYFINEGNFQGFSLIQTYDGGSYVKPGALATMTTSGILAGRNFTSMPTTGIPQSYRADFGPSAGGATDATAVWTDGMAVTGAVTLTDPGGATQPITVTNEYGGTSTVQAASGTTYSLPLSGQVTYLTYPAGDTLAIGPTETYGTDVASAAAGASAVASSGGAGSAIQGHPIGYGQGWGSADGDTTPSLTVNLASTLTIDRVMVDTQSAGSTASSVRNYTISGNEPGKGWVVLATEVGEFRYHQVQFAFAPVAVSAVRIDVSEVNFGGYYGGGIPPFWPSTMLGHAMLHSLQAYAGTGGPAMVGGSGLPPLVSASMTGGGGAGGTGIATAPSGTNSGSGPAPSGTGYRLVTSAAEVKGFGTDSILGPNGPLNLKNPIVGIANDPAAAGYWLVGADGGIFNLGAAGFYGSTGGLTLNKPIVGMAATADGKGYWLVGADGGIFNGGDASYFGSTGALHLNKPVVGMAATRDGKGYWLVASDGGIFAFGDAQFFGSTGALHLNKPVVGMAATRDGKGYWLVASDGGIFAFGDAQFFGSTGALTLHAPIVGMAATPDGKGYWLVGKDGGIFSFGDAPFLGSSAVPVGQPAVGMAAS